MSFPRAIRPATHPFPFLLYVEWGLLGLAVLGQLTPRMLPRLQTDPTLVVLGILAFSGLGLWLPQGPLWQRIAHTGGQFALILLTSRLGAAGLRLFPLLYVVLVIRSCLLFRLRGRFVVSGIVVVLFTAMVQVQVRSLGNALPPRVWQRLTPLVNSIRLNLILIFVISLVFMLLLVNALLAERDRREELRAANQKLQASAAQIEKLAMAQERSRIAREIHDALGHSLTGLNIQLEGALKFWEGNPARAKQFVSEAKQMGSTALQDVRQAVSTLRELPSPEPDLAQAIATLTERFQTTTGITPHQHYDCPPLSATLQTTVYRILQEALTNICKYANATAVDITVQAITAPLAQLHITVVDDGQGFSPEDNRTGFGLRGMQERATAAGGQFRLISAPEQGCQIHVWFPLPTEQP
ncbi:MAG: sensor histidine kinase [Cyanobacteria bacterium P01_H01_bin.58]